jgi:hypothetical protein
MRRWVFQHAALKLVSVGLALALWMAVAGEQTVERGLRVPLELQQMPAGLNLVGEPPTVADVRVRGPSGALARLVPGEIVAVLELRGAAPGRRLFQLTPQSIRAPFGLEVTQVVPASVALEFEQTATRRVPIAPTVQGEPAPGFVVGAISTDPKEVEISGPATAVSLASEALTEEVLVSGAEATVVRTVSVGLLNPVLRVKSPRAAVRVEIVPGPRERTLRGQPVRLRSLGGGLAAKAVPAAVDVVMRGSREDIGKVGLTDVTAFVDLAGLGVGVYNMPVKIESPPKVGVMRIDPVTVRVDIDSAKN